MESGGEEDDAFTMGEREWQKMNRDLSKQGYRDGKNEGREQGRQKAFEAGTKLGLNRASELGQFLGIIEWKLINKSLSVPSPSKPDRLESQVKLTELQKLALSYLENLKTATSHTEDSDEYKKLIEVLKQEYVPLYPSEEHLISQMFKS